MKDQNPCEQISAPLGRQVRSALNDYFQRLDGHRTCDLYRLILAEVEKPLLTTVMEHTGGNQTRASEILGINRSTLRKKLQQYDIDKSPR